MHKFKYYKAHSLVCFPTLLMFCPPEKSEKRGSGSERDKACRIYGNVLCT